METVGRPMQGVLRRPWLFVCLFLLRFCGYCVLEIFVIEVVLFFEWLCITSIPWFQLASVLGDKFGCLHFSGFVGGVLVLSLFS